MLLPHLAVHAVGRLLAPAHIGLDALALQPLGHHDLDLLHQLLAVAARAADRVRDRPVAHRVQGREGQVLEFVLEGVDPEPVRDRRIDVQRLARDAALAVLRHRADGAHVVQPVGQLDQDDADVVDHRQHHLLEIRRLLFGPRREGEVSQLAEAIDQARNRVAELFAQGLERYLGILQHIVQQGGDDAVRVERELGHRPGNRQGMVDVGLAAQALLALVGAGTELVGMADAFQRRVVHPIAELGTEIIDRVVDIRRCRRPIGMGCLLDHTNPRMHRTALQIATRGAPARVS